MATGHLRAFWIAGGMLALLLSGGNSTQGEERLRARLGERSRFGLDYVFALGPYYRDEKWPRLWAESGAGWVQFAGVSWRAIEPKPPRSGTHDYRWSRLDEAVQLWQRYGFHIAMWLQLGNGWFAGPVQYKPLGELLKFSNSDRLPKPEFMADYESWVTALVERYDGDGHQDMPGLLRPILYYQCGNEYANPMFWTGTLEEYITLLKLTRRAARRACPKVKIISNSLRWNNFFHGDPRAEHVQERWQGFLARLPNQMLREGWQRNFELNVLTIRHAELVDVIDVGGNGGWPTATAGYFTWVNRQLAKLHLPAPPPELWDAEARCEPQLKASTMSFHPDQVPPDGKEILGLLKRKSDPRHEEAVAWYRAEQARLCVKVFVTRFAAGAEKVFMGMPSDWDNSPAAWIFPNPYVGLVSSSGQPWPAFYAMKLLASLIDGFKTAEQLPGPKGVELYRFGFDDGRPTTWVAWLAEERLRGLSEPLPTRRVRLAPVTLPVTLYQTPTTTQMPPARQIAGTGALTVELDPTPLILVGKQ